MGKPSAPKPPDPKETAQASTSTNIGTAVANAFMGNANQITPDGSLSYDQTGNYSWHDPYTGKTYDIPRFTATQTLSPAQQRIRDQQVAAQESLAGLASQQAGFLKDYFDKPFSLDGGPAGGDFAGIGLPQYQGFAAAPELATTFGDAGDVQRDFGDAGALTRTYGTDFSQDRQRVEDAMLARLQPQLDAERERLESRLANQGVRLGSTGYGRAQDDHNRAVNDARLGVIMAGGQEQSRLAGLERDRAAFENAAQQQAFSQLLGRAGFSNAAQQQEYDQLLGRANFGNNATQQNFANQFQVTGANNAMQGQRYTDAMAQQQAQMAARDRWIQEQFATRSQPLNEISALISGSQVSQPNFINANMPTIPTTDVAGLINTNYNQRLQAWQQQQQSMGGLLSGLGGLFGSIIGLSDDDAKKDKKKIGTAKGYGLYEYRLKGESRDAPKTIGVMASEVEKKKPEAVHRGSDGYRRVDYGALGLMGLMRS